MVILLNHQLSSFMDMIVPYIQMIFGMRLLDKIMKTLILFMVVQLNTVILVIKVYTMDIRFLIQEGKI